MTHFVGALVLEVLGDLVLALEGRAVELAVLILLGEIAHRELLRLRPRAGVVLVPASGAASGARGARACERTCGGD